MAKILACQRHLATRNRGRSFVLSCYEQGYKDGRNHRRKLRGPVCDDYTDGVRHGRGDSRIYRGGLRL